ncbi:hypothetical protein HYZ64_00545, partial [Candidatus Berkelbacteria bacterium]|nr:hypothetical protein [Candidatus Berkelbacteria bacterium]
RWVRVTGGADDIFQVSAGGNAMRYREEDVRPMGRGAAGVRGMKLKSGDKVVSMDVVARDDPAAEMLIVLENGYGKRTKTSAFSVHNRGGLGMRVANVTGRAGKVVTGQVLTASAGDMLIISSRGQTIRTKLQSAKLLSREAQGVIVMRLNSGDKVASVTVIPPEEVVESSGGDTRGVGSDSPRVEEPPEVKGAAGKMVVPSTTAAKSAKPLPRVKKAGKTLKVKQSLTSPSSVKEASNKKKLILKRAKKLAVSKKFPAKKTSKLDNYPPRKQGTDRNLWGSNKKDKYF